MLDGINHGMSAVFGKAFDLYKKADHNEQTWLDCVCCSRGLLIGLCT